MPERRRGDAHAPRPIFITLFRSFYLSCLLLGMLLTMIEGAQAAPLSRADRAAMPNEWEVVSPQTERRFVLVLTFRGAVTPVLRQYLDAAINDAQLQGAEAVILRLDTPGGSVEVTKQIVQEMLASPVPVVVYVAPARGAGRQRRHIHHTGRARSRDGARQQHRRGQPRRWTGGGYRRDDAGEGGQYP